MLSFATRRSPKPYEFETNYDFDQAAEAERGKGKGKIVGNDPPVGLEPGRVGSQLSRCSVVACGCFVSIDPESVPQIIFLDYEPVL